MSVVQIDAATDALAAMLMLDAMARRWDVRVQCSPGGRRQVLLQRDGRQIVVHGETLADAVQQSWELFSGVDA